MKIEEWNCHNSPLSDFSIRSRILNLSRTSVTDLYLFFVFSFRRWRHCLTRIPSTTWWTVWRNRAWRQCPKDIWGGKALIWTWLSSSTFMRFEAQKVRGKLLQDDVYLLWQIKRLVRAAQAEWIWLSTVFKVHWPTSHTINFPLQMTLRHEDGDDDSQPPPAGRRDRRRVSLGSGDKKRGLERRRSRRASLGRSGHASPCSPASPQRAGFQPFNGQRAEDMSERWEEGNLFWAGVVSDHHSWAQQRSSDCLVPTLSAPEHCQVSFHPCKFKGLSEKGHQLTFVADCCFSPTCCNGN